MRRPGNRGGRRYVVVAVLALVAILVGAVGPLAYGAFVDTSAKDRIEADPPPALFPDATVSPIGRKIDAQATTARTLMATWWRDHGRTPHDAQFVAWVERTLPGPPSRTQRSAEIRQVQSLAARRTSAGVRAATWLEAYGKKDVWKLAAHDQAELLSGSEGDARKNAVDDMLTTSKTIADTLGTTFQVSAPYVIDPSLRPDHHVPAGATCPCSYPSRHASAAASSRTFLGTLDPERDADYRHWQDQIDYSRLYMAGHVPSDIAGGTLLGDMIGDYFLVTRAHLDPQAVTPAA